MRAPTRECPLLIAEIGVNHDGDPQRAAEMVLAAAAAGFDAVKFQYWLVDELLAPVAPNAPYQGQGDQRDLLAPLALQLHDLGDLAALARQADLGVIVTPDGQQACHEVLALGLDAIKIGSGDADNPRLLEDALAARLPLLVSTGMMTDEEIDALVARCAGAPDVTLLHCVSAYPTALEHVNLARMQAIAVASGRPVGFSDHTLGVAAAAAAVALGAVLVEKHVTWSTDARGPDHAMSLPLDQAATWVQTLRRLAQGVHAPTSSPDERMNRSLIRKGLYAARSLDAGHTLSDPDLLPLRPLGDGIPAGFAGSVQGRRLRCTLEAGALLTWAHVDL